MSAAEEIITALMGGGMDASAAASLVARAAVEMTMQMSAKSVGAARQQRYRERNKRNESVTNRNADTVTQIVTNRNESVTPLRSEETPISYLPSLSKNLSEKKESKKERIPKKRNVPLRDDWAPSVRSYEIAEQNGVNVQIVEQIFRDYLKSSGKFYADYDAAFHNFLRNQRRFNGSTSHAKTDNPRSGSIIAALDRALERSIAEDAAVAAPENTILSFPGRSVF